MSIVHKVRELVADAIAHGHANEFPEPVQHVLQAIAEHVEQHGGGEPSRELIDQIVRDRFEGAVKALDEVLTSKIHEVNETLLKIDDRIEAKFAELLAKASAAEPAAAPAATDGAAAAV